MTLRESIVDALVEVKANRGRTILQTLGIILGVASLVAVQGLSDASRFWTALELSSDLVGSSRKPGSVWLLASVSSKRTSRLAAISTPVASSTTPSVRSTTWPRAERFTRSMTTRPPSAYSSSTELSPTA